MPNRPELVPYDPSLALPTAQAFLEVFTTPPLNEVLSLNDALSQLESDANRDGFGGILLQAEPTIVGFSWWYAMDGVELHDRWRPRFTPKEKVPQPEGHGVYLTEFGILPRYQHHGLGKRLFERTLSEIEPDHDWIALSTNTFAHAGLALLKSKGFEDLGLKGVQVPTRICLIKYIRRG